MRTAVSSLELLEPKTLGTALKLLRTKGPLMPLAGCTDVYVSLNFGTLPATGFLDLSRLSPLRRIREHDDVLSIGALATYTDVIRSRLVHSRLPMLVAAARELAATSDTPLVFAPPAPTCAWANCPTWPWTRPRSCRQAFSPPACTSAMRPLTECSTLAAAPPWRPWAAA